MVKCEDAVFDLYRSDGMYGVRTADCVRRALREPYIVNLAFSSMMSMRAE